MNIPRINLTCDSVLKKHRHQALKYHRQKNTPGTAQFGPARKAQNMHGRYPFGDRKFGMVTFLPRKKFI